MSDITQTIFSGELDFSVYEHLTKLHGNETEQVLDFGRFCRKNKLYEEVNQHPEEMYKFFSIGDPLEEYIKIYSSNLREAIDMYRTQPMIVTEIMTSWKDDHSWDDMTNALGMSPVEVYEKISKSSAVVVLKGDPRPDAPVPSSTNFMMLDEHMEFEPVIIDGSRACWKFRSGFFFGKKRLVNKVTPSCLWNMLDTKMNLDNILENA